MVNFLLLLWLSSWGIVLVGISECDMSDYCENDSQLRKKLHLHKPFSSSALLEKHSMYAIPLFLVNFPCHSLSTEIWDPIPLILKFPSFRQWKSCNLLSRAKNIKRKEILEKKWIIVDLPFFWWHFLFLWKSRKLQCWSCSLS